MLLGQTGDVMHGGKHWVRPDNLIRVGIDDIEIAEKDNDLVLGSYGRGIFIWDDITMLQELSDDILNHDAYLFTPRETVKMDNTELIDSVETYDFRAPNPPEGVLITYYLKNGKQKSEKYNAKLLVDDIEGKRIAELEGTNIKGFNRIAWSLEGIDPGTYTITLTVYKTSMSRAVSVKPASYRRTLWH